MSISQDLEGYNSIGPSFAVELARSLGSSPDSIKKLRPIDGKPVFIPAIKLLVTFLIQGGKYLKFSKKTFFIYLVAKPFTLHFKSYFQRIITVL